MIEKLSAASLQFWGIKRQVPPQRRKEIPENGLRSFPRGSASSRFFNRQSSINNRHLLRVAVVKH
jgi:hypothetical protein